MSKLKISMKTSEDGHSTHYYINGEKTNLYWFNPCYRHYDRDQSNKDRNQCDHLILLIAAGKVGTNKGDWEGFDQCRPTSIVPAAVIEIGYRPHYRNEIYSCSGCQTHTKEDKEAILAELKTGKKTQSTQYCKLMPEDCSRLYNTIGVKFDKYGYAVYAITS